MIYIIEDMHLQNKHNSEREMPKPKSHGQLTVKIPRRMAEAVEDFLKSERAQRLGLDSKADVVTMAVRELLAKYEAI